MPALNETSSFDTLANPGVKAAFKAGSPVFKVRLAAGGKLFKWTQYQLVGPRGITPWWSLLNDTTLPNGTVVPGFAAIQQRIGGGFENARDYARARNAVTLQWNQLTKPLVVALSQDVFAFVGITAHQRRDQDDDKIFFIGGDYQVWLPGLTVHHVRQVSALPYIRPLNT
ncbi:MAG: hypothetical protein MUF01_08345 [Bryobacterales bacterium]|jgi:hypothetical protein|nr:hypothetical protein [Bryobacterales bacterium]